MYGTQYSYDTDTKGTHWERKLAASQRSDLGTSTTESGEPIGKPKPRPIQALQQVPLNEAITALAVSPTSIQLPTPTASALVHPHQSPSAADHDIEPTPTPSVQSRRSTCSSIDSITCVSPGTLQGRLEEDLERQRIGGISIWRCHSRQPRVCVGDSRPTRRF